MKNLFILGRNPKLSRAEVIAYINARNIKFEEILFEENYLVLNLETENKLNIQDFGGVLSIGEIEFFGVAKDFKNFLNSGELIPADKFSYSVLGNIEPDFLKDKFKEERKKASLKHGRNKIEFQDGSRGNIPKADYMLFLYEFKGKILFGKITEEYSYSEIKKRDMNKPVRREELAISPRLSKILINLSGAKENSVLLDPFCGVGGILQEALIKGMSCYGVDKDKTAIEAARKNLDWIKSTYKINNSCKLDTRDSREAPNLQFDAVATETPLGVLVKHKLSKGEAEEIIQNFEALIIPILTRLKVCKKTNAKIAITFPKAREISVNIEKIAKRTGLKLVEGPYLESRKDQFISREILVLV